MKTLEITGEVAGGSLPRLVRSSPHYLEVVGLKCGIRKPWMKEPCGGKLRVEDFRPKGVRGELRYELHCDKCKECDPNGWARQDKLIPAAPVAGPRRNARRTERRARRPFALVIC